MNLQLPHLDLIAQKDQYLAECLRAVQSAMNSIAQQTGATPQGPQAPPAKPVNLNVTASGGIFDIAIQDNQPAQTQIAPDYFLEYSHTANFASPIVIHLGPARNHRANLGNQTLYWRTYSQIGRASQPSERTYYGDPNDPTAVVGGGAVSGPNLLPSAGSGTAPTNGLQGGSGYGTLPVRNKINQL